MLEFFQECIQGPNLIATVILGVFLFFWLFVILGFLGLEAFDFDLDSDVDFGADADIDSSFNFGDVLNFFHLGEVPVMIFGSIFALFFWVGTLLANRFFNDDMSMMVMLWWLGPCLLVSLFGTKFAVMPLVPLFETGGSPEKSRKKLIGENAIVTTKELNDRYGQITIQQDGPPLVLNARTENNKSLAKGDKVEIVRYVPETGLYIVKLAKWENVDA